MERLERDLMGFSDPVLKIALLNKDNIPPLEHLLNIEQERLIKLQKLKQEGKLDFGKKTSKKDLPILFNQIKNEVDSFIDVKDISTPKHEYFSLLDLNSKSLPIIFCYACGTIWTLSGGFFLADGQTTGSLLALAAGYSVWKCGEILHARASQPAYYLKTKSIILRKKKRVNLISHISHEYTHYVQGEKAGKLGFILGKSFTEGYARGVSRNIARIHRKKEDNEAFLYTPTDFASGELKSVYQWICASTNKHPRKSLLKAKSSRDEDENLYIKKHKEPTPHAIGNTLFYLTEIQNNEEIYKKYLPQKIIVKCEF